MAKESGLDLIGNNFEEIRSAFQNEAVLGPHLVSWGNRLYYAKGSLRGRFFSLLLNFISFFNKGYRQQSLHRALLTTHDLFQKELISLESHTEHLKQAMLQWQPSGKYTFDQDFAWFDNFAKKTDAFIKLCKKNDKKIQAFFDALNFEKKPFYSRTAYQKQKQFHAVRRLLNLSPAQVPFEVFRKIQNGESLSQKDQASCHEWEAALKQKMKELSCEEKLRILPQSLHHVFLLLKSDSQKVSKEAGIVESLFKDIGKLPLEDRDEKQIAFRDDILRKVSLNDSSPVKIRDPEDGLEIIVGKALKDSFVSPHKKTCDTDIVFEIVGDPDHVLVMPPNTFTLSIRHENRQKVKGIRPAVYEKIDSKGRFAIVERLTPLKDNYAPLVELLKDLLSQKEGITNFHPKYLMLDKKNKIASVKECVKCPYDFTAIEEFVFFFSKSDYSLYKKLIEQTGMENDELMKLFSQMNIKGFDEGFDESTSQSKQKTAQADHPISISPNNTKVAEHALSLYMNAKNLIITIINDSALIAKIPNIEDRKAKVRAAVKKLQINSPLVGRLWPNAKNLIISSIE